MYDPQPVPPVVPRTLVIPMHQESARIEGTLAELARSWHDLGDCELVLVDDGSTDGTAAIASRGLAEHGLPGQVVRLERNGGKGAAISAGIANANGRTIAFTDADLAAAPDAIRKCFELIEAGDADVVVTSRHLPESEITVRPPLARRSSSAAFRRLTRWAGLRAVSDSQCGLKAFDGDAARALFHGLSVQRFAFDVEVLLRAELAGLRVVEVPIRWRHVEASTLRTMRDGARMLLDVVRLRSRLRGWDPDDKTPVAALLEREHWWYVANREVALAAASSAGFDRQPAVDLDCQTGGLLDRLRDRDIDAVGVSGGARPGYAQSLGHPALSASTGSLPLRGSTMGAAFAVDLLEHLEDDGLVVREAVRVLASGGMLVATVPSNPKVWSGYDVALGHRRRYSPASLRSLFANAGLDVVSVQHFFAWLSPITFVLARTPLRTLLLRDPERSSFVHRRINRVLRRVVEIELMVTRHVPIPFGQALVVVGRKP